MARRGVGKDSLYLGFYNFAFIMRVLLTMFLAFIITLVSPNHQDATKASSAGDVAVEAHWADQAGADVDLWVRGPGDELPVGYSRRSDRQFSYLRDDVGRGNDSTNSNYEFSFSRGVVAGTYVVNVHLYGLHGDPLPVVVTVVATITLPGGSRQDLASATVTLTAEGQETTAFSFELTKDGGLVPGSISQEFIKLRGATSSGATTNGDQNQ